MTAGPGRRVRGRGRAQPGQWPHPGRRRCTCCPGWSPPATSPGSGWPRSIIEDGMPAGVERDAAWCSPRTRAGSAARTTPASRTPASPGCPRLGVHVMTYVAYGPLGPRAGAGGLRRTSRDWRRLGPMHFELPAGPGHRPQPVPQQGRGVLPRAGARARTANRRTRCCTGRCGTSAGSAPGEGVHLPAGVTDERPGIWVSYVPVGRGRAGRRAPWSGCVTTGWSRCRSIRSRS